MITPILLALILLAILWFGARIIFFLTGIWTEAGKVRVAMEVVVKKLNEIREDIEKRGGGRES